MIKKIIQVIIMISAVIGGAVAADFIKGQKLESAQDGSHAKNKKSHAKDKKHDSKKDSHGKDSDGHGKKKDKPKKDKKDKHKNKGAKDSHGKSAASAGTAGIQYLKFDRQFVIPVMENGNIDALVIMNLSIELNEDAPDDKYQYLPRMRDAMVRELLSLSDEDIFGANLTSVENYQAIRDALLRAAKTVMPEGVQDILILDLARQEQ